MIRKFIVTLCLAVSPLLASAQALNSVPRLGVDYEILPTTQPTYGQGKIEIAEVFSYGCIHCFHFQPLVNEWQKKMPADVRWEYVPAGFGGPFDEFARAFFAAQILGVQKKTHDAVFKGVFVDHYVTEATPAQLADLYARFGVDRGKFLSTMAGEEVKARFAKAHEFALRTGIEGTPTLIVNGKYRITGRATDGLQGMLKTLDYVLARERERATAAKAEKVAGT